MRQIVDRRISIHALLAESDYCCPYLSSLTRISIHALLAESDQERMHQLSPKAEFLSTLSLRRATLYYFTTFLHLLKFLSTLSLRRATEILYILYWEVIISIHALLAESDGGSGVGSWQRVIFLSTLSLRRATIKFRVLGSVK